MPDKKKFGKTKREHLLGDLQSVKELLSDKELVSSKKPAPTGANIPLLLTDDQPIDSPKSPAPKKQTSAKKIGDTDGNPFLSTEIKDKLAKSQSNANKELNQLLGVEGASTDRRQKENWQKAQRHLRARSTALLQEVIEQAMPSIEAELRKRLRLEMDLLLEEMQRKGD